MRTWITRYEIKNKWSNHSGLSAMNLLLNNVYVMYRYDIRTNGKPYRGWRKGTLYLLKATFIGWWGKHNLRDCRVQRKQLS